MKKLFYWSLLAGLFLLEASLPAQNLLLPLLADSSHHRQYDLFTGDLQRLTRQINRYNAAHRKQGQDLYSPMSGQPDFYRDTLEYDALGRLIRQTRLRSQDGTPAGPMTSWIKATWTYDAQDRVIDYDSQFGNAAGGWDNNYHELNRYDDGNHRDTLVSAYWDNVGQVWENHQRQFHQYNTLNQPLYAGNERWDTDLNDWTMRSQDWYTYHANGLLFVHHRQKLIIDLITFSTDSSLYRADGRLDSIFHLYQTIAESSLDLTVCTYDANGDLQQKIIQNSNDGGLSWQLDSRHLFVPGEGYYSNDYSLEIVENYQPASGTFKLNWKTTRTFTPLDAQRVLYVQRYEADNTMGEVLLAEEDSVWYYLPAVAVQTPLAGLLADCSFANPLQPGDRLVCRSPHPNLPLDLRLYDLNGQLVLQTQAQPDEPWQPGVVLPVGLYTLAVWQSGQYLGMRRFVAAE